jgi:hypothetical protein
VSACHISYIPARLHTDGREDLTCFEIGEVLYRRCPPKIKDSPFEDISLVDLSVNREGPKSVAPLCEPTDVLYNFTPEKRGGERIEGEVAVALVIRELTPESKYVYSTQVPDNAPDTNVCIMELVHKKELCNYAHCAFELRLNGELVTFENYKASLGAKEHRHLRTKCRFELANMIVTEAVWLIWPED